MENLSEREKAEVAKILKEISQGKSDTYKSLLYEDYDEIPVDIHTFLRDRKYLGNALYNTEGKFTVFPYWEETMEKIFPDPLKPAKYNTLALTGAIGLGKSFMAVLCMLYELYRMMCLKNPYTYYGLQPIDKITFAVMNITLEASRGVAWDKLQQLLQSSEWFMERGTISGTSDIVWNPPKGIELITGSLPRHILGRAVFCAFIDEVSFQPNADIKAQIEKAKEIVNAASIRMQSRFMKGNKNPTLLIIASSKRTEQSYMETFIARKKKLESKTTYVVDEPQWIIRTDKDSKEKFYVAVGNKFLESTIVPLSATEEDLRIYRDRGYSLLKVPIGYYEQFEEDIEKSLQDIAGYSTTSSSRYISGVRLKETKHSDYQNAFTQDIIETGNGVGDDVQYYDYFDLNRIPYGMKEKPLYIHLDMSISGDKTGLAGVWIKGTTPHKEGQPDSKDGVYQVAFSVSIKAPKGTQISFAKNRQFIKWLREQGFNIKLVSFDTFQSYDTGQELQNAGFNTEITSVDKCTDHICLPYQFFKSVIYEKRLILYDKCDLLTEEIIGLERDNNTGRIDHSPTGINCFTGDTKIRLVDGRSLSILNLKKEFEDGKVNFVYSFNHETQRIEPRPISNVFKSGHNATLVEVTLDNGEKIHCTPEHKFMLRDGTYCEAKNLHENQSLMSLYAKKNHKVVSVKYLSYVEDVYDITIDVTHNFALDAGVFVHNSKDACDSVCAATWNASKHIEEFNFDFGETLDAIVDVSSSSSQEQTQQQVLLDFESELLRARQAVPDKKQEEDYFLDFGFGKRGENFDNYMMDGIII